MDVTVQHINNSKDTSIFSVSSIFELIRLTTITNFCQLFLGRDTFVTHLTLFTINYSLFIKLPLSGKA